MKKRYFLFSIAVLCLAISLFFLPRPTNRTPEQAWDFIVDAYLNGDSAKAIIHETEIGKTVTDWLFVQGWVKNKLKPEILRKKLEGDRYEIYLRFNEGDGIETVSLVFFRVQNVWKFHDLYLENLKGDDFRMYLSKVLISPKIAGLELFFKNPLKPIKSAGEAVGNALGNGLNWAGQKLASGLNWGKMQILQLLGLIFACMFIYDWFRERVIKRK
jgi:hypothetical protein